MRWFQFSIALVQTLILANVGNVCAVGRGLRSLSHRSNNPSVVDQGPSPAELEEQEEDDGVEDQELDAPQLLQQENNLHVLADVPGQSVVEGSEVLRFASPQDNVAAPVVAAPSLQTLSAEPTEPDPGPSMTDAASDTAPLAHEIAGQYASLGASAASLQNPPAQALSAFSRPSVRRWGEDDRKDDRQRYIDGATPFPVTVPGLSAPLRYIDGASASSLFPKVLPASVADPVPTGSHAGGSFQAGPKNSFQVVDDKKYTTCHPPCIQGRGICNDNMCFCKSPFVGTTCQHKVGIYSRASFPMVFAFAVVSFVMGGLGAQIVHAVFVRTVEGRLQWLHATGTKQEVWCPPGAGKPSVPRGHAVQTQKAANEGGD